MFPFVNWMVTVFVTPPIVTGMVSLPALFIFAPPLTLPLMRFSAGIAKLKWAAAEILFAAGDAAAAAASPPY
jgi:hypothetical protein